MTAQIEEEVLAVLRRHGRSSRTQILEALPEIESAQQLSNTLHRLKAKGAIVRVAQGEWDIAGSVARTTRDAVPARAGKTSPPLKRSPRTARRSAPKKKRPPAKRRTRVALSYRSPAEQRHHAGSPFASPEPNDPAVLARLEKAERDAQGALDDYVASVCDPRVLAPLRQARDAARRARERYANRHNSEAA